MTSPPSLNNRLLGIAKEKQVKKKRKTKEVATETSSLLSQTFICTVKMYKQLIP